MCRQELILKTRECDFLRNKVRQLEKVCGQVGVVDEGTTTVQEGVKTGGGRLSKTLSRDRKDEVTREPCDSCVGLRKQLWELQLRLEKYQDECGAYMEQSTEQKRQVRDASLHACITSTQTRLHMCNLRTENIFTHAHA